MEFLAAENLKNTIPAPLCRRMGHRVPPIPSGNRVFGVFSCRKPQKHDSRASRDGASGPPRSVAGWGIGSRQFRAGIVLPKTSKTRFPPRSVAGWGIGPAPLCRGMGHRVPPIPSWKGVFGVFSCRKPQKHDSRPALSRDGASGPPCSVAGWGIGSRQFRAKIVFLEFLAAEILKNTIPAPLCRGMGHRVPPIPSGNRVFGVFSCQKPQKHDSRPALSHMGHRVCRKPQKHDSRSAPSRDGASGPANSERESCFWSL